jgi:hypothetical protein
MLYQCLILMLLMLSGPVSASGAEALDDDWFAEELDLEARVAGVNQGDLVFLSQPPEKPVHHHHSRIVVDSDSLDNGWVTMTQCHSHLDAVPRTQVVYHQTRARELSILSHENVEQAWVEGHTVQLAGVAHGASICIRARTRTLEFNEDGSFSLRGGPFMRRFLDGYYPMHVSMSIEVPQQYLRFADTRPQHQDGFDVRQTDDGVYVDAWFEGKLYTEVRFEADFCDQAGGESC